MSFDLKKKAEEVVDKLKKDPKLLKEFEKDPVKALEKLSGIDLPDEQLKPVIAAVKAKLATGEAAELLGKLGKAFK
jgi:hypothetical protein